MAYEGQDRQILVTQNTEYHMQAGVCVAVRCSRTGRVQAQHQAIGSHMLGRVLFQSDGSWALQVGGPPNVGQRIFFSSQLVTSPVQAVNRDGVLQKSG